MRDHRGAEGMAAIEVDVVHDDIANWATPGAHAEFRRSHRPVKRFEYNVAFLRLELQALGTAQKPEMSGTRRDFCEEGLTKQLKMLERAMVRLDAHVAS